MFRQEKICEIKNFLSIDLIELLQRYCEHRISTQEWLPEEFCNTSTFKKYSDPLIEAVLAQKCSEIEEVTGIKLYPTYSYIRLYKGGDKMPIHVDRPSCEISVTVNIANFGKTKNPFCYENEKGEILEVYQNPGDAVVYLGKEVPHGRYPHSEDQVTLQCMLHYVDQNGKHSSCKFDTRPGLGMRIKTRTKDAEWIINGEETFEKEIPNQIQQVSG